MSLQCIYCDLKRCWSFDNFREYCELSLYLTIDEKKGPNLDDIKTVEFALATKMLATNSNRFTDPPESRKEWEYMWQVYWLQCCLSESSNYTFSVLSGLNIYREDELKKMLKMAEEWENFTDEGKQCYYSSAINFLLKRYAIWDAIKLWWKSPLKTDYNFFNLFLPRLFVSNIIGFLFIISSGLISKTEFALQGVWKWMFLIFVFLFSLFYLKYEINKTILISGKIRSHIELFLRSLGVLLVGLVYSIFITCSMSRVWAIDNFEGNFFLYAILALFIGIIVQLLWEDKNATDPL